MNIDWDRLISREIEQFLVAFQQIAIDIAPAKAGPQIVTVHAPYMMQRVALVNQPQEFSYLKQRHQDRLLRVKASREQAPEPVKQFLREQLTDENGRERLLAAGRAELGEIGVLLQKAVRARLVPLPNGEQVLNGRILRNWLKTYGIGVDCSSFVQQALNRLLKTTGQENSKNAIRFLRSFRAYKEIKNGEVKGDALFTAVPTPAAAHPSDVLVKYGHIRIIANVEECPDGSRIFHLGESTSAPDIPAGQSQEEADIGPRCLQVRYPAPYRPIQEQQPARRRQHDFAFQVEAEETKYVIGRFIPLAQFRRA